jgi:hypothetical protein
MPRSARATAWIAIVVLAAAVILVRWRDTSKRAEAPMPTNALELLLQFEEEQARQHWGPELQAQRYNRFVDALWDRIASSTNKLGELASLPPFTLTLPRYANAVHLPLPHGIVVQNASGGGWPGVLLSQASEGWTLQQCELRQVAFSTNRGPASTYYLSGHLANARTGERAIVEGEAVVWWNERPDLPPIREVDARALQVRTRRGPAAFERVLHDVVAPPAGSYFIDPLLVWDLDNDGSLELVLAAKNVVYKRAANATWQVAPFLEHDPGLLFTGMLGDFTGNGTVDFAFAKFEGIYVAEGSSDGRFRAAPRLAWTAAPRLRYPQAITAGDIDGDGDLDLFLGQYKVPYTDGQMPYPYFDANDGFPCFVLANDGAGNFADVTARAGLSAKRARRVYSASFADLDRDADLDLVVVSDFAGLDAYLNDGAGRFSDVTAGFGNTKAFGMSHTFLDVNRDDQPDLLMIGMNSPTADRLASLELRRAYDVNDAGMRDAVTYGNRLYLGTGSGKFAQTALSDRIARTGWSWAAAAGDLDNDGHTDLCVANGHETKATVQEYEPHFWLHDIYVGRSQENHLASAYFRDIYARTRGRGYSYGGYEKNRLFLNLGGTNFVEVAHLFGVALEQDSRNVLAEDLNGDGRLDLIVTTFEMWLEVRQTLQIFENRLATGNWMQASVPALNAHYGASYVIPGHGAGVLATGDGYRAQRPFRVHVGLGTNSPPLRFRMQPVARKTVEAPLEGLNRLHRVE